MPNTVLLGLTNMDSTDGKRSVESISKNQANPIRIVYKRDQVTPIEATPLAS